jgi:glycosyltransferase involved in cell wall biosynthesis
MRRKRAGRKKLSATKNASSTTSPETSVSTNQCFRAIVTRFCAVPQNLFFIAPEFGREPSLMRATVVITTKNRRQDLLKAIASALDQTVRPQVLVIDDASTDGTAEVVAREFPAVQLARSETSRGYIAQRNRAARLAESPILFSLDDDAVFSTPTVMERTLQEFDHPRVGAVAIPFVDVNRGPAVFQKAPQSSGIFTTYSFIGTAHALRRDLFLELSGYREILFHQGEEEDYCIRMLNAGWITRCGNADPIHHFESPRRSWTRMDFYGARNKVLYAWHNVPFPAFAYHLAGTTAKTLVYTRQPSRLWTRLRGVAAGYAICALNQANRRPVTISTYRLSQELKRRGAVPLNEIVDRLKHSPERSATTDDCIVTTSS